MGLKNWTFSLDTAKMARGPHHIDSKAFAANLSSEAVSVDFTVNNPEPSVLSGGNPWCLPAIGITIVAALVVWILLKKRVIR